MNRKANPDLIPVIKDEIVSAYDVLGRVVEFVLADPRRINMNDWYVRSVEVDGVELNDDEPDCGTVACVGGWISQLTGMSYSLVVGLDYDERGDLFHYFPNPAQHGMPGTREYAKEVARHVRAFMAKHESELRKRIIDPATHRVLTQEVKP